MYNSADCINGKTLLLMRLDYPFVFVFHKFTNSKKGYISHIMENGRKEVILPKATVMSGSRFFSNCPKRISDIFCC